MRAGWQAKKLGDVATLQRGFDLPTQRRVNGDVPLVTSSGITDTHNMRAVSGPGVATGRSGSIGNVFFIEEDFWPLNTVLYVKDFHGNDPRFVYHLLKHFDLKRFASGTGVPTLNRNFVHDEIVNVPTLPEQKRIVAILDEALEGIATAKVNAEKNILNARAIFESHLQLVISQRGKGWVEETLESCCDNIFAGGDVPKDSVSLERTPKYSVPIFSNGAEDDGLYGFTDVARVIRPSVTISARGTLGFAAIRTEPFVPVVRLIVLTPAEKRIELSFLYYAMVGMDFGNTGTSIPQLTVPNVRTCKLRLPPLSVQRTIVNKLDALRRETQRLAACYERKLVALESLKKSLLHHAFAGKLTAGETSEMIEAVS